MNAAPPRSLTVTVVVPLFNGRDLIVDCLRSVPDDAEVIVVDDGSTDGAPELVAREFPRLVLLRNAANAGFGTTANRGLRAGGGDVRVVLNSDARLRPGALDELIRAFDDPCVGIAGPRLVFPDGTHQLSASSFPTIGGILAGSFLVNDVYRVLRPDHRFPWEMGMSRADHQRSHAVDWVMGTCLAIRDQCLDELDGFDEGYYLYAEETDLCWRARREGWVVTYVADAMVEHLGGGSTGDPRVHARRFLASEARFMARAYGPAVLPRWRLARLAGAAAKVGLLGVAGTVSAPARQRRRWQQAAFGLLASEAGPLMHAAARVDQP